MTEKIIKINEGTSVAKQLGLSRSSKWPKIEKEHLIKEPQCIACKKGIKTNSGLQVHHIIPFQFCVALGRPDLELDERNLITLCENVSDHPGENHHLLIGHLDDFKSFNINVRKDASSIFKGMSAEEIRANTLWKSKNKNKPKHLDEMTTLEKNTLKKLMDKLYPVAK